MLEHVSPRFATGSIANTLSDRFFATRRNLIVPGHSPQSFSRTAC